MKHLVCYLAIFALLTPCFLRPFIYEVTLLKRWIPEFKRYQYFVGISDFHDKKHAANETQRARIQDLLDQQNKETTMVITEDLSGGQTVCGQFKINSKGGILGGLTKLCQEKGFTVDNIEYRYCRVAALGPLLTHANQAIHECPSTCKLRIADIAHEVHQTIDAVSTHTPQLADTYKKICKKIPLLLEQLQLTNGSPHSVADYIQEQAQDGDRLAIVEKLLTFDADLVDFKLARSVLAARTYHTIIAFAGGSHISRVITMLLSAGYKQAHKIRSTSYKEYDLSLCFGIPVINKSFCMKPEPINLEALQRLLADIGKKF